MGAKRPVRFCAPCGKQAYHSWAYALRVVINRTRHGSLPLRIYRCPLHAGLHLTSKPSRGRPDSPSGTPAKPG